MLKNLMKFTESLSRKVNLQTKIKMYKTHIFNCKPNKKL
jgi:hypothetical protein